MGIRTPYATGPAPVYYSSGYFTRKEFWRLGLVFGVIFPGALLFNRISQVGILFILSPDWDRSSQIPPCRVGLVACTDIDS